MYNLAGGQDHYTTMLYYYSVLRYAITEELLKGCAGCRRSDESDVRSPVLHVPSFSFVFITSGDTFDLPPREGSSVESYLPALYLWCPQIQELS